MPKARYPREFWLLAVVALLVLGAGLGLRDPWPADEPRFALVAMQMVESGDWLFPHRGIELYPDKPPVVHVVVGDARVAVGAAGLATTMPAAAVRGACAGDRPPRDADSGQ